MKKYLETTKDREAQEAKIEQRQAILQHAWQRAPEEHRDEIDEMFDELTQEWLFLRKEKEWLFNFKGDGWNSIMAADKEIAIRKAKLSFPVSQIDENTFRIRTEADYKNLMGLFH